jgi:hypothetical protein
MKVKGRSTILILGDSTSMSIGVERKTHPFVLADRPIWPEDTQIINCSLPGMTAADAAAFFLRHKKEWINDLNAVLIYLGNCDTTSTEVRKGSYTYFRYLKSRLQESMGKTPAKTSIKNRLLHFEWNNTFDPKIENPEDPADFEHNIRLIYSICKSKSIPVILVRPKANLIFLSGIGKGNFVFYKYLGIKDNIADKISIPDQRFKEALKSQENGDFLEAAKIYKSILTVPPSSSMSNEYQLLVMNNYAVAKAESGEYDEAEYLLNLLLKEQGSRKEIFLYNLARISKLRSNENRYRELLVDSYEVDTSLYRVRTPYVTAIDKIVADHPDIRAVDMESLIPESLYLDHCHPLPEGQVILADKIAEKYAEMNINGSFKASIRNILYNPELASGNVSDFHEYFKTFASLSSNQVQNELNTLGSVFKDGQPFSVEKPEISGLSREIKTAFEYYLRHPVFTSVNDILHFSPVQPSDIGRFPEYFIIRHLIPYMRLACDKMPEVLGKFDSKLELLKSVDELMFILPDKSKQYVETTYPEFDIDFERKRLPNILHKVHTLLADHLSKGNQVFERTKTTIFWYVRETLRFGSHSRYSMRYDRLLMEFLAEGLAVAAILDSRLSNEKKEDIERLIGLLQTTVNIHDEYCTKFSLNSDSKVLLHEYDLKLREVLNSLNRNKI